MARNVQIIQDQIEANLVAQAATIGIAIDPTQWSRRNLLRLICFVVATAISVFEQNYDQFKIDTEAVADKLPPQTEAWFSAQALKFQYSAADPQIIQLDTTTLTPYYPTINTDYQIIKFCSVSGGGGNVVVKVAAAGPTALTTGSTGELAAFQSYLNQLDSPGINITATSFAADEIYISATIYYVAQYSAIIQANVIAAIEGYLAGLPFSGKLQLTNLEIAIMAVAGVKDVTLNTVRARTFATAFPGGTVLMNANVEIAKDYVTYAGYIIPETTSGSELTDTLTFVAQ